MRLGRGEPPESAGRLAGLDDPVDEVGIPRVLDVEAPTPAAVERVRWVEIRNEPRISHRMLFDPGHGMEERLMREQFV